MLIDGLHEKQIFDTYPFRLAINTHVAGAYPLHWHKAVELLLVVDGDYRVQVNREDYALRPGDILLIAGGDLHAYPLPHASGERWIVQFDVSSLDAFEDLRALQARLHASCLITPEKYPGLQETLRQQMTLAIAEYNGGDTAHALAINARIFDILVALVRHFGDSSNAMKSRGLTQELDKALAFIEAHYHESVTLPDTAAAAGFSPAHFSRLFRKHLDCTFQEYVQRFRIHKAEKMLMQTDSSIADTAFACGFGSVVAFNRAFLEHKGCTPSQFRKLGSLQP